VASYVFNTALGTTYSSATYNFAYGGPFYSNASPSLGATVTINGHTVIIDGSYLGEILGLNFWYVREQYITANYYSNDGIT
jgi:hypothetical protein